MFGTMRDGASFHVKGLFMSTVGLSIMTPFCFLLLFLLTYKAVLYVYKSSQFGSRYSKHFLPSLFVFSPPRIII